jgi:hypothetical protein
MIWNQGCPCEYVDDDGTFSVCIGMKDTVLKCFNAIGKAYQMLRSTNEPDCMSDLVSL